MAYKKKILYLTIYNLIKKGVKPIDITRKLQITRQHLNYYLSTLKRLGYIKKIGYGTWIILRDYDSKEVKDCNPQRKEDIYKIVGKKHLKRDIRGHAFIFKLKTPTSINLKDLPYYLNRKGKNYQILMKGGIKLTILGKKVHIWKRSIIVYDKASYVVNKANEARKEAIYEFLRVIRKIETLLGIKLFKNKKYKFKVKREHYGIMKALSAKYHKKDKILIADEYGFYFCIDNSYKAHEVDIWKNRHPKETQAIDDTEGYKNFINDMKKHEWKVTPSFVLGVVGTQAQNLETYTRELNTHVSAIRELATGVKELRKVIKKLNR